MYDSSSFRDAQKEKELKKKAHTLFDTFLENNDDADISILGKDMGDSIRQSFCNVICTMKRKSGEEYLIPNDFFAYLLDRYKVKIEPFDRQLTSLERQLSIAKDMHDFNRARDFDREKIAEKYLVSKKTVDNDLAAFRDGICVMDQKLALENFQMKNKRVTAISTMHPLFLAQNLTQIVCMLEGLRMMEADWTMRSYAKMTAVSIWCQLSDYAKNRILNTLVDLMGLDGDWYRNISRMAESKKDQMFYNEKETSDRFGLLMYALKGSLPCFISFIDSDDTCREIRGKAVRLADEKIQILPETGEDPVWIEKDRILEVEVATELQ